MSKNNSSKSATPEYRVDRKVVLSKGGSSEDLDRFLEKCESITGILRTEYDSGKHVLAVSYNLYRFNADDLFEILDENAILVRTGMFDKLKYGAWRFSDNNQKDILVSPVHCCNKSPK